MSASVRDQLQTTLGEAYALERELGGGGMSRVFVARDAALGRDVVIKVLAPGVAAELNAERFAREIRLAASLQQANIVPVLAAGQSGALPYYLMPFVDGLSLRERLGRGPVGPAEARSVLRDVARALDYAHARDVVHRDIKPENILLSGGAAVVTDFGIAKAVQASKAQASGDTLTSAGTSLGTPAYMAPEQAAGDAVDARTDLYAWGLVAYELLAGRHPFAGRTTARQFMTAHIAEAPPPLSPAAPGAPSALVALVERCLAKEPAGRPASAAEVLRALEDATTEPPAAGHGGARARAPGRHAFGTRRPALALVAAALLVSVGVLVWRRGRAAAAVPNATVGAVGTAAGGGAAAADPAPAVRRLAVLPFENLGRPEDAYVADGVADEIRGRLATVPGMQVIARGSSNAYRDAARAGKDPAAIAAELGVRYLLTGTVRSEPGAPSGRPARVRVAPELVEVVPGSAPVSRWAQSFDADLSDAFAVQADVASRVAAAMDVALGGTARTQLAAVPTRDAVAYDAYLRGRAVLVESEDVKSARRALGFHTRAVTLDPTFAEAWAERGRAAASLYNRGTPSPALAREARDAADRALALAPDRAAGYHALGDFYTTVAKDPARAVEAYAAARRLAPGDADVLSALAYAQQYLGRAEVAVRDFRAAQALDPRSPITARRLTTALLWSRRYAEARAAGDRGLALAPANAPLREARLMVDLAEGDVAAARRVIAASPPGPPRTDLLVFLATYWDLGWMLDDADQRTILALGPDAFDADRGAWGIVMAQLYALRGDSARARAFGDSARLAIGADVRANPDDAQRRVLYGLAAAYAGRAAEAVREAERGMSLQPVGRNAYVGAYVQHQAARAYLLAGRPERAIELLEQLLRMPYYLSPAWLRIDPTFAPLRSHPEFERLVRSPATRPTA